MLALLALASSAVWGTADFFAGLRSRTLPPPAVVGLSQAAGLVALTVLVAARWGSFDGAGWPLWAIGAGLAGATGLISFYAALAAGTMGVVAAIASLGAAVPVALGVLSGDRLGPTVWLGVVVAIAGAALASGPELSSAPARRPLLLAALAAVGFGCALFCIDRGSRVSLLHTLWGMRLTSVALFAAAALALRSVGGARAADLPSLAAIGLADLLANAMFAFASSRGLVSVASVLGSLYPVATLAWARLLLGERLRRVQVAGVVGAVAGIGIMTL